MATIIGGIIIGVFAVIIIAFAFVNTRTNKKAGRLQKELEETKKELEIARKSPFGDYSARYVDVIPITKKFIDGAIKVSIPDEYIRTRTTAILAGNVIIDDDLPRKLLAEELVKDIMDKIEYKENYDPVSMKAVFLTHYRIAFWR